MCGGGEIPDQRGECLVTGRQGGNRPIGKRSQASPASGWVIRDSACHPAEWPLPRPPIVTYAALADSVVGEA